jgi:hypothetical protein
VLRQLSAELMAATPLDLSAAPLIHHGKQPIRNTRGAVTGEVRPAGLLHFFAA